MIKKSIGFAVITSVMLMVSGCSHKMASTPAVMTYDGSNVDYSKIGEMKMSKLCSGLADADKDTTIIAAAKQAGISKIKHVDTSYEYSTFLFWTVSPKNCITVYGE